MAKPGTKVIAQNRKVRFNYELERKLEAGLALEGGEVKSIKAGDVSINEAFVSVRQGEAFLEKAYVKPYQPNQGLERDPTRTRKLLLKRDELSKLAGESQAHRRTIVPTKLYLKSGRVKLEIAVARGKRQHDKRETTKKREAEREAERALKRQ